MSTITSSRSIAEEQHAASLELANVLYEKKDAIASMAAAHPDNKVFAEYSRRANAILGDRAIPLLEELERRIGAAPR